MSFPTIRGSAALTNGTNATATPVVNLPATVVAGDTIFVVIRAAAAGAIGWPGGAGVWNELHDGSPDGSVGQTAFAWKKADGSESGTTITLSSTSSKFAAVSWAVQDAADPDVRPPEISTVAVGTTGEPDATTCTPTGGTKDYLWLTFFTMEGEQTGITAYPASFTLGQSGLANSGTAGAVTTNATIAGAARQLAASSLDAGVWDVAGTLDDSSAWTVAFHPGNIPREVTNESSRVIDTVVAVMTTLLLSVPAEAVKVSDSVSAALVAIDVSASISEQTKVDDGGRVDLYGLGNPIRITDGPVLAELIGGDMFRSVTENVKADDGGQVDLFGLGNPIRITDGPVIAQLFSSNLDATASESLKVVDGQPSGILDLIATVNESLKVVDGPVSGRLDPVQTSLFESLKVVDTVLGPTLDPEQAGSSEFLKVVDTVSITIDPEQATPSESLKVVDSVLGPTLDPEQTTLTENLKVVDGPPVALLVTGQLDLTQEENVRADDGGRVDLFGLGNPIRITDGPVLAALVTEIAVTAESLKVVDGPPTAALISGQLDRTLTESLKVVDSVFVILNPEQATPTESVRADDGGFVELRGLGNPIRVVDGPVIAVLFEGLATSISESLKVVDTLTASRTGNLSTSLSESLKVVDSGEVELSRDETIRISDALSVSMGGALGGANLSESLKVVDAVTVSIDLVATLTESLKVVDSVTAIRQLAIAINESLKVVDTLVVAIQLSTQLTESLVVSDGTPVGRLNPIQVLVTESLKVVDETPSVTSGTTLAVLASETVKVSDTAITSLDPEQATPSESLKVVDTVVTALQLSAQLDESIVVSDGTPTGRLNPLLISLTESLKVIDIVATGTTVPASASEAVKIVDSLIVAVDPELLSATESLLISDTVVVTLNPEETTAEETVRCSDVLVASLSVLNVNVSEGLRVVDQPPRFGGPRVIDVIGGYSGQTLDVVGGYSTQVLAVVGGYGEGD